MRLAVCCTAIWVGIKKDDPSPANQYAMHGPVPSFVEASGVVNSLDASAFGVDDGMCA